MRFRHRPVRVFFALSAVGAVTFVAYKLIPVNATTVGFAYLLLVLVIASTWGFFEAAISSIAATLVFNFFFFPPVASPKLFSRIVRFQNALDTKARRSTKIVDRCRP